MTIPIKRLIILLFALLNILLQADAHAQTEEVKVEWDFSKRSSINQRPFAKLPLEATKSGLSETEDLKRFAGSDLLEKDWVVQFSDGTVRRMMQRWADDAGYQLLWDVPRDYPIEVEVKLHGRFRDAVKMVATSLAVTDAPVQASINPDIRLVRVIRYLNGQAK